MAKSSLLLDDVVALRVTDKLRKGDWFFLTLIGANLDPEIFTRLVNQLDKSLNRRTAMGNGTVSTTKLEKIAYVSGSENGCMGLHGLLHLQSDVSGGNVSSGESDGVEVGH